MPVLEAMAAGLPVVTSNRSALPEVAGDAAMPKKKQSDGTGKSVGRRPSVAIDVCCSFCGKNHEEAGPFAEGRDRVFICLPCAFLCQDIIENECQRLGIDRRESHE